MKNIVIIEELNNCVINATNGTRFKTLDWYLKIIEKHSKNNDFDKVRKLVAELNCGLNDIARQIHFNEITIKVKND